MSADFTQNFNHMLASWHKGTYRPETIDLHGVSLTKPQVRALAKALADNFHTTNNIVEIDLSFCDLHELPHEIFKDCDSLRRLNLANNHLKKLPHLPDRPYALQEFLASNNPLKDIPEHYFAHCNSLKTVYLNATQIAEPPSFADSLYIAWLHLNANPIRKFPEEYFTYLDRLDSLFINGTHLKEMPNLARCARLQEVWIDDIKIPPNHIAPSAQIIKCASK